MCRGWPFPMGQLEGYLALCMALGFSVRPLFQNPEESFTSWSREQRPSEDLTCPLLSPSLCPRVRTLPLFTGFPWEETMPPASQSQPSTSSPSDLCPCPWGCRRGPVPILVIPSFPPLLLPLTAKPLLVPCPAAPFVFPQRQELLSSPSLISVQNLTIFLPLLVVHIRAAHPVLVFLPFI